MSGARPGDSRHRTQAGITLLELLIGLALTGIIMGPLAMWTISTVRQQGMAGQHLSNAVSTGRVSSTFSADIASARNIAVSGASRDCPGGPGAGGTVRLSLLRAGTSSNSIVYSEARPDGAPSSSTERSLWRRECSPTGLVSASELFPDIRPGSVSVRCPMPAPPPPAIPPTNPPSNCPHPSAKRVQLTVVPDGPSASPQPVVLNATRRADAGSIGIPGSGNRPPVAQIDVDALVGYVGVPFRFSGAGSEDLDGPLTAASYRWEFPTAGGGMVAQGVIQVDHVFTEVGEHTVLLQVTDAASAVNVAAITVRVVNRHPTASAVVTPETGEVGVTMFHFDARASTDNDADVLSYRWDLGPDAAGDPIIDTRAEFDVVFPAGSPSGPRRITLTVDDPRGGRDVRVLQVGLGGPSTVGGITINPEPVVTGAVPVVGTVGPGRPDLNVSFSMFAGDPSTSSWRLTTAAGATVYAGSGDGATLDHVFGVGEHGEYRIARVATNGQVVGTERTFRVNAAPVAAFTTTGGSTDSPRSVDFTVAGSSDPDGSIVAVRWTFGFIAAWTSSDPAPTQVFSHPGRYQVRLEVVDSDGATTSVTQDIQVTGAIPVPAAPRWQGDQVMITAVPGAEAYRLHLTCGGIAVTMLGTDLPASPAPTFVLPTGTCVAPAVAAATYELSAGGVWSPTSPAGARP